jgi:hypothetical protein
MAATPAHPEHPRDSVLRLPHEPRRGSAERLPGRLALFNVAAFFPGQSAAEYPERQQHPVFGRFLAALAFRGFGTAGESTNPAFRR